MNAHRWRLHRAGLLNVWQYDNQVFDFADGRLLLRGTNGAGKSKTLEMLLPFVLDGDRARMDASGRRGSALSWLMLDGYDDGGARTGYVWLELRRTTEDGTEDLLTAGVGLRASASSKSVNLWYFLVPRGALELEDVAGAPLSPPACREVVGDAGGEFFESTRAYKAAVGRRLFGLDEAGYDELLRLLYWLRSPQVGESVEVAQLDRTLSESLPELDRDVVEAAAASLDELQELGEQVERRARASADLQKALSVYQRYATGEVRRRTRQALATAAERASAERALRRAESVLAGAGRAREESTTAREESVRAREAAEERQRELAGSEAARDLAALEQLRLRVQDLHGQARRSQAAVERAAVAVDQATRREAEQQAQVTARRDELAAHLDADLLRAVGLRPVVVADGDLTGELQRLDREASAAVAAVELCLTAASRLEEARHEQSRAEEVAAEAESQAHVAQEAAEQARSAETDAVRSLERDVSAWLADAPVEGTLDDAERAAEWAAAATATPLRALHERAGALGAELRELDVRREELALRRERALAERDPAPPLPVLDRDDREGVHPLWRVVDPAADLRGAELAGLEAALQDSGLLDALVLPDGRLQRRDRAILLDGEAVAGASLADVLRPVGAVPARAVEAALRRIALDGDGPAVVRVDGSWVLGALEGRATKPVAQFLGVVARQDERARRVAALDRLLDEIAERATAVQAERATAGQEAEVLVAWRDRAPSSASVLAARVEAVTTQQVAEKATARSARLEQAAVSARQRASEAHQALAALAAEHGLPSGAADLQERRVALRDVRSGVSAARRTYHDLVAARELLVVRSGERVETEVELTRSAEQRADDERSATQQAALYDARREALSATQHELERALADADEDVREAKTAEQAAHAEEIAAEKALTSAHDALERAKEHVAVTTSAAEIAERNALAVVDAPGLLSALQLEPSTDWAALAAAVADLPDADGNAVHRAFADLMASSAGSLQPRQSEVGDGLYVLTVRDEVDGGEQPLAHVAATLAARVLSDQELLTRQHRQVCERHLLGELGEVLRRRRLDAAELVQRMNELLADVRTSQGIRVRLDWRLRDDVAEQARETVDLLQRPLGSLLPEQRERLLGLLSDLVEAGRREDPDAGYAEHLRAALDYRRWSTFVVRIRRADKDADERLTKRTALSQGEQKVVCYLPLFAAAAAHFSSLAAEAPHAPRFVLLDDAFPKIDVRTHPVLFGLLVDLDLDWLITSERLWADCDTVPAAAVYEVIRSPNERGVLPFKHLWDGRRLTAVGV